MRFQCLFSSLLASALLLATGGTAAAQVPDSEAWLERCRAEAEARADRGRVCEVRELTLPAAAGALTVDGRANGGVEVQGWDRNEIRVHARITAHARTQDQARSIAQGIRIPASGNEIRAEGPRTADQDWWSVSYQVFVPNRSDLNLRAANGGLQVANVGGRMQLETVNGGISLAGVSGDVRGRTTNGGMTIRLAGDRWQGEGLDLRTSNGGVTIHVPDGYSAQLETGTVNGRINTEIPITVQGEIRRELSTQLGRGGAPIRVRTTNGAVHIRRS